MAQPKMLEKQPARQSDDKLSAFWDEHDVGAKLSSFTKTNENKAEVSPDGTPSASTFFLADNFANGVLDQVEQKNGSDEKQEESLVLPTVVGSGSSVFSVAEENDLKAEHEEKRNMGTTSKKDPTAVNTEEELDNIEEIEGVTDPIIGESTAIVPVEVEDPTVELDRSSLPENPYKKFSEIQEEEFQWEEVSRQFKEANPSVAQYYTDAFARKHLKAGTWSLGQPVPNIREVKVEMGQDYYFRDKVPTMLITAFSKVDAKREVTARGFEGFWRRVSPITGNKVGYLQQKGSLEKYNQNNHTWSEELLGELALGLEGSQLNLLEAAKKEGYCGPAFVQLVWAVQENIMPPDYKLLGMYTPETRDKLLNKERAVEELVEAVNEWIENEHLKSTFDDVSWRKWTKVNTGGLAYDDGGVNVRNRPTTAEGETYFHHVAQNTRFYIMAYGSANGRTWYMLSYKHNGVDKRGYAVTDLVWRDVMDPGATSYKVEREGESAIGMVERELGDKVGIKWGQDLRFMVNAVWHINFKLRKHNKSKKLGMTKWVAEHYGSEGYDWETTRLIKDGYVLMPSVKTVKSLHGKVESGSWSYDTASAIANFFYGLYYAGAFVLAFIGGAIHGLVGVIYDIIADLIGVISGLADIIKQMFTGEIIDTIRKLGNALVELARKPWKFAELFSIIGDALLDALFGKYRKDLFRSSTYSNPWKAGHRWGYTIVYFVVTILLTFFSAGAALAAKIGGKAGKVLMIVLKALDQLESLVPGPEIMGPVIRKGKSKPDLKTQEAIDSISDANRRQVESEGKTMDYSEDSDVGLTSGQRKDFDERNRNATTKDGNVQQRLDEKKRREAEQERVNQEQQAKQKAKEDQADRLEEKALDKNPNTKSKTQEQAEKQVEENPGTRKGEKSEKIKALAEAKLITEGADLEDMDAGKLVGLLNSTVAARHRAVTGFGKKHRGNNVYTIVMFGSEYDVKKWYTEAVENGTATEEEALLNQTDNDLQKQLDELGDPDLLEGDDLANYNRITRQKQGNFFEMMRRRVDPANERQHAQFTEIHDRYKNGDISDAEAKMLLDDIYSNPGGSDLTDAWKSVDNLGDRAFDHLKKDPNFLRKLEEVRNDVDLNRHIFYGDQKLEGSLLRGVSGVHSNKRLVPPSQTGGFSRGDVRLQPGTKSNLGNGYYDAKVQIYGDKGAPGGTYVDDWLKGKKSTFFPDSWNPEKIQAEIAYGIRNKVPDPSFPVSSGNKAFKGIMTDGTKLELVYDGNKLISAFPNLRI